MDTVFSIKSAQPTREHKLKLNADLRSSHGYFFMRACGCPRFGNVGILFSEPKVSVARPIVRSPDGGSLKKEKAPARC
jgi:hypothetical protein